MNSNYNKNFDPLQTEILSNVASYYNHIEKLSQYTLPGVAVSVAQQKALYRA